MTHLRANIDVTGTVIVRPSLPVSHVRLRDITFLESLIVIQIDELHSLLARVPSSQNILIKLCKCFRTSIYTRDAMIEILRVWYVDSNTNVFANETMLKDFNSIIDEYFNSEYLRHTNDWFFTLIEHLSLEDENEYYKRFVGDALVIDKRRDIHDFEDNTTYNHFTSKAYDFKDIHKCISDIRSFVAVDKGDEGTHEFYHVKFFRNGKPYIRNYNSKNKKHVEDFKRDLSKLTPFKMNKNINVYDIFNQWKYYFTYD